jgi:NAD(P)-dependent dehydrogenase (short-subunit alcohol dehydrogenase family)
MSRLKDKIAIVTGAGQGVGRGIALAMAKEGAHIVVAGRNTKTCPAVVKEVEALGQRSIFVPCDVVNKADIHNAVVRTIETFGAIDILVNNAHDTSSVWAPFVEWTDEALRRQMESSYMASVWFMRECFPHLKARGGRIINIGSGTGVQGQYGYLGYSACKAAQSAATRVAAREWGEFGITVNMICPLADSPPIQKIIDERPEENFEENVLKNLAIKRIGRCEEDIGRTAVFLASEDASYITGYTLNLDGGLLIDGAR